MKLPRIRFRLHTLLLLFVLIAICCWTFCWWKDRPRRRALQFANHVNSAEYSEAREMIDALSASQRSILSMWEIATEREYITFHAKLDDQPWKNWWEGKSNVKVVMTETRFDTTWTESYLVSRNEVHFQGGDRPGLLVLWDFPKE